jgi:diguanylate cyclase (GGDEF)-like protein
MTQHVSWRSTYLLGVALLLPIGTIVLVCYYFTRMNPFAPEALHNPWAYSILAVAGGLSALMATFLALFSSAVYRARVRFEAEYRKLQRFLNEDVAKERTRLIRNLDLVSAAQQVSMAIKQEVDFERILPVVLEQLEHFTRADSISVFTVDQDGNATARAERRRGVDRFPPNLDPESVESSLVAEAARNGRQVRSLNERTGEFVLAVYFSTPAGDRGVVRIARNVADEPDFTEEIPSFEQAVAQLVRMVSLGLKTASIWDRAIKDEKTGLFNNNHYQDQIKRMVAQAKRSGSPLSLVMMDIDKFKHINDTYGHLAGDAVLEKIAELIKREARESDTPFRYGGEELCILCGGTTEADAALAAERLRSLIATTEFYDERGRLLPISASFGVAEFDSATMESDLVLKEMCDRALYVAKENGRNLVVIAQGGEKFELVERTGEINSEVKYRLGLSGDNSPLEKETVPRKAATEDKAERSQVRAQLGESIDALATGLAEVVGNDSQRAKVVDSAVREATEFLTRNLSARLDRHTGSAAFRIVTDDMDAGEDGSKKKPAKAKPKKKATKARKPAAKRTRKKAETKADGTEEKKPAAKPKRKPAARKTKPKAEAEEAALAADSDRLDYLTDAEGEQLVDGKAPSKRARKVSGESARSAA